MSVKLRLTRMGRKKRPYFRIVAVDSRTRRDGAYLDKLGHYDPLTHPPTITLDEQKALDWLLKGAEPSDTVKSILSQHGVMMIYDLKKKGASPEKIDEEMKKMELLRKERESKAKKVAETKVVETPPVEAKTEIDAEIPQVEESKIEQPAPVASDSAEESKEESSA